ncbi:hypothetical protein WJX81_006154 [Elliptochloris bilobata]|uniref:PPM-type phosphatase domain-containing protein n=1 Tax=Elliptochloris bilobata TaxID=381761 RepID=A0AAW1SKA1_9CHLO
MERGSAPAGPLTKHLSGEQLSPFPLACGKRTRAAEAASGERRAEASTQATGSSSEGAAGSQAARCDRIARSRLSFGDELEDGLDGPGIAASTAKRLCFGVAQARGARQYMEDKHTVVSSFKPLGVEDGVERSYFAVFDGHNGEQSASEASSRLHAVLAQDTAFAQCRGEPGASAEAETAAMRSAMTRTFAVVDGEILDRARAEDGRDGSTGLVVVRTGSVLWAAHAGDSRAVLARGARALGRGQRCWRVICEPRDGRPGSGLAVSRSFGDLDFKHPNRFVECKPDVLRLCLQPDDDLVILASDGLWDVMDDQLAVDLSLATLRGPAVASGAAGRVTDAQAKMVADALVMEALQRHTLDNITVIVLLMTWD